MSKYQRKQETVDAIQYLREENLASVMDFCSRLKYAPKINEYYVVTPNGAFLIEYGSYILKDSSGNFYVHKKEDFEEVYKPLAECNT